MSELTSYPIRKLLDHIYGGQIRVPAFQRGFVWDADHVAHFLDSIYKGYPFGSLLFWLTQGRLLSERKLGPFDLPAPHERYPVTYVLDGQQRVTSLFVTFQTEFVQPADPDWRSIYFDLAAPDNAQQSQFVALKPSEVDQSAHFPLNCLFDSVAYRLASARFTREREIRKIDRLHSVFKEAQLPIQMMETEDRATVAIVFERINRMGVELTTLELLSAWTWSEDFDLRNKLEVLQEELENFSFGDIGSDPNLVLRCCAAILKGDPSVEVLIDLDGAEIRDNFERVENGIKGAIEFLKKQLKVATIKTLPYPLMLAPLSVYFAVPGEGLRITPERETRVLKQWFWRSCFSERYSGQSVRAARIDVTEMQHLREGRPSALGSFQVDIAEHFFLLTDFRINSAKTATFVTMLAQFNPRSFISGSFVDLERVLQAYNKAEFHHIFPRSYVEKLEERPRYAAFVNSLANFCFLSRADNNKIRASAPSQYRRLMPSDSDALAMILESACVDELVFEDDLEKFLRARVAKLTEKAYQLCGVDPAVPHRRLRQSDVAGFTASAG
ncbi:DUF262 domain-containing protein [Micromonospora mirobrigensis]|uniref:GmrSD restriction endonucleases N-terminal domain-containing protein n=1 Tax=Micromonospora mirobrigensis TaxID=262898 RepID=A0A1C5AM80_9ACTN|nr:DUF262 domain-containing protein [Micromonospora mirobrigensis]SCF46263.1 hypothetical protein GA0070564_11338 [Micromonospora mirobrigensis]